MDFPSNAKPIYLQIADFVCDRIAAGQLKPEERLPSVREYGAEIGVNPNTVARTYERLSSSGIIYSQRGMGYFVAADAPQRIIEQSRQEFMDNDLPQLAQRMRLLGIELATLVQVLEPMLRDDKGDTTQAKV